MFRSMSMKQTTTILFILFTNVLCSQNLVVNPSFEDFHDCPRDISFFHKNVKSWSIPNNGTTDYFNLCSEKMGSKNFNGSQEPRTGKGYAGIYVYFKKDYREYIQGKLKSTLKRGKKYQIRFYISLAEHSKYALRELGMVMRARKYTNSKSNKTINAKGIAKRVPTMKFRSIFSKAFFDNDKDWTEVTFTYTAEGFENYFAIGNFNQNATTKKSKPRDSKYEPFAYYYIDDVSIEPLEKEGVKLVEEISDEFEIIVNEVYKFKNVLFDFNEAKLLEDSIKELNELSKYLSENLDLNIEIYGHTDNLGSDTRNKELSEQRAKAVADYLISQGLDYSKIKFFGYGSSKPISSNETDGGRQLNRRVEFKLIDK